MFSQTTKSSQRCGHFAPKIIRTGSGSSENEKKEVWKFGIHGFIADFSVLSQKREKSAMRAINPCIPIFQTSFLSFSELPEPILMILGAKWPQRCELFVVWENISRFPISVLCILDFVVFSTNFWSQPKLVISGCATCQFSTLRQPNGEPSSAK